MIVTHVGRHMIENSPIVAESIIISIVDPESEPANIPSNPLIQAIHRVEPFHDIDAIPSGAPGTARRQREEEAAAFLRQYVLFNEERAAKIAEFVKSFERKMPPWIIVHCEAGISRSAGVAAAIQRHYDLPGRTAFQTGLPNSLVFRLTFEALQGKPLIPWEKL